MRYPHPSLKIWPDVPNWNVRCPPPILKHLVSLAQLVSLSVALPAELVSYKSFWHGYLISHALQACFSIHLDWELYAFLEKFNLPCYIWWALDVYVSWYVKELAMNSSELSSGDCKSCIYLDISTYMVSEHVRVWEYRTQYWISFYFVNISYVFICQKQTCNLFLQRSRVAKRLFSSGICIFN